jgi:hypothetical protein
MVERIKLRAPLPTHRLRHSFCLRVILSHVRLCLFFDGQTDYTKPFGFPIQYPARSMQMPTASHSTTSRAYPAIRRVKLLGTNVAFPRHHCCRQAHAHTRTLRASRLIPRSVPSYATTYRSFLNTQMNVTGVKACLLITIMIDATHAYATGAYCAPC